MHVDYVLALVGSIFFFLTATITLFAIWKPKSNGSVIAASDLQRRRYLMLGLGFGHGTKCLCFTFQQLFLSRRLDRTTIQDWIYGGRRRNVSHPSHLRKTTGGVGPYSSTTRDYMKIVDNNAKGEIMKVRKSIRNLYRNHFTRHVHKNGNYSKTFDSLDAMLIVCNARNK
ncbi:unnamed protein product [Arabis nemorensis]|uniref:Uncharacterized protein n=1 Tax=Arabis nemorensis TaxID=586526 RepID=A0A565BAE2_9BRAS|nr:unnamed protein product [Arabis nemorensis]